MTTSRPFFGRRVAELRIPFASPRLSPTADLRHPVNLFVRKQRDDVWVEWRGIGNCTWYLPGAGLVRFVR